MLIDKGLEKIGDLLANSSNQLTLSKKNKKPPAFVWQDLALRVIKELNIPNFKKSAVFKVCKLYPRSYIEKCLNDTKELCQSGEKWKYFFKIVGGQGGKRLEFEIHH